MTSPRRNVAAGREYIKNNWRLCEISEQRRPTEAHSRPGFFSEKYDKVFGRYLEFFLGYLYGNAPELGRTDHVRLHHRENSGPDDTRNNISYDRTSRIDFLWYLSENIWTALGLVPYAYFKARSDEKNRRRMLWGMARYYTYFVAVFIYDWRIGIMFVLVPLLCMNFINAITAWVQHAFCDPDNPLDYFANTVTVADKVNFLNEGYHLCHHHQCQSSLDRDAGAFRANSR
jgi:fatty acid desaturase